MVFKASTPDFELSPYTGLTRQSWIEAGGYLLEGIFDNIADMTAPIVMPRQETKITYPHLDAPAGQQENERRAEIFEGLTRSLFIAAPLLHENPKLVVSGYSLRDYYKSHILRVCTPEDPVFAGSYESLSAKCREEDPFRAFQQTVEACALVIGLWECKEVIWDTYTKREKDVIAAFLTGFAHGNTVPQNWRLFNMLELAFLYQEGYPIDEEIMVEHVRSILHYYVGDGWYRDGHSFDYYSCWAFQVYAPLWNLWYGYEKEPGIAALFEEHSNKLMETYPCFFDREGHTNMWGRSNIYRNASTSAFAANFLLLHPAADPGLARRIASGSLLQFLSREDFRQQGVPTLGFYGQFLPLVQGYSCAESPLWLGKAFLCLHLPKDHPFWMAKEHNGIWENLSQNETKQTVLSGPALCVTNHGANGGTILRSGKVLKHRADIHGMWNYAKLAYHTHYPWEASPLFDRQGIPTRMEVEAQQYVLRDDTTGQIQHGNAVFWHGEREGVLYRRLFFDYDLDREAHWIQAMDLADFPIPFGILRVDRPRLHRRPVTLTLGAFGFPDNGTEIEERTEGTFHAIIVKGKDAVGKPKQLAMTIYYGFEVLDYCRSEGTNPDSRRSLVPFGIARQKKQYGGGEPCVLISQVITKEDLTPFSNEELFALTRIQFADHAGGYGEILLEMKDGTCKRVDFSGIEGHLSL